MSGWRRYGVCGLSEKDGKQLPYFFDFLTSEWKELGTRHTLALFSSTSAVGALQQVDTLCFVNNISGDLETCDYQTTAAKERYEKPEKPRMHPLPENLKTARFGDYPGVWTGTSSLLFSANLGNGRWVPVIFDILQGFFTGADTIAADALFPFSFLTSDGNWQAGYLVAREEAEGGSELYLLEESGGNRLPEKPNPVAVFPVRAVSVSANYGSPSTVTVHFQSGADRNTTYEYSFDKKEWKAMDDLAKQSYDEIVWTN